MTETAPQKTRFHVKKGRYEKYVREALASKGESLISVNWKSRRIHYLDEHKNKKVKMFFGL